MAKEPNRTIFSGKRQLCIHQTMKRRPPMKRIFRNGDRNDRAFTLIELPAAPACFSCVSSGNMRYEIGNMRSGIGELAIQSNLD